ncbi:helix-turn-helix domain-containing protein [Flavobacterium sp. PLA-1-15]|uniref:helix-turn-helix domain-containing protein n=1 Tax=Flavobacterium sp. PLA-1-15 TaxID=3380533 RepID=UPI003B77CFB1
MLKLDLDRFFKVKGIRKAHTYMMEIGNSAGYATKLINGQAVSIPFDKLELLCEHFNCTPNDLFNYIPDSDRVLPASHALHSISKTKTIGQINALLHELPMEKIEELYGMLKKD